MCIRDSCCDTLFNRPNRILNRERSDEESNPVSYTHLDVYKRQLQSHVISIAKQYHNEVEMEMDKTQVLSQIFIEEYSQELSLKGPLCISINREEAEGENKRLNLGDYFYGCLLYTSRCV